MVIKSNYREDNAGMWNMKKRNCKLIQEFNKLETAILRQDKYVDMFGHHRAMLQVIRVVKNLTSSCDAEAMLKMPKMLSNSNLQNRGYNRLKTSLSICTRGARS